MTDSTLNGFAPASTGDERLTFLDTADRHIRYESRSWVTMFKLFQIFRHLDDTLADWLLVASFQRGQKPSGDIALRDGLGFDDPNYRFRF